MDGGVQAFVCDGVVVELGGWVVAVGGGVVVKMR